ncbi:MAG: hypothetical protein WB660_02265 [Candidatus Sulfotelmatobacter sp.]
MTSKTSANLADNPQEVLLQGATYVTQKSLLQKGPRTVMAQLLHALNQPLTGLQCSMEVALASPRTAEQYAINLQEGLQLTERMRTLVEAIREVTDMEAETSERTEAIEWKTFMQGVVNDLVPVAEVSNIRMKLDSGAASSFDVMAVWSTMAAAAFRLLESALSLAVKGAHCGLRWVQRQLRFGCGFSGTWDSRGVRFHVRNWVYWWHKLGGSKWAPNGIVYGEKLWKR